MILSPEESTRLIMAVENEVKCIIKFGLCISRFFFKEGEIKSRSKVY
jgi:hypothetical protein